MKYFVYGGLSNCFKCGKRIKTIHVIDDRHYGAECAKSLLGREVSAPAWLYDYANNYMAHVNRQNYRYALDDLGINFWNWLGTSLTWTGSQSEQAVYVRTVKIAGKPVNVQWQHEITDYLHSLHS